MKEKIRLFILLCVPILFQNCARNPVTGKQQLVLMSEEQEIATGREADPQIIAQYGLYADSSLQQYIRQKGQQVAAVSHRKNIAYEYKILDSDVLNAFATPGGFVYFTRGIMAYFNDEAQFEGVLGHETGHIAARHSVSQQRNALLGQIGIMAGVVIEPRLAQYAQTASQGLQLLFLKYSRDAERQADELGVEYSTMLNYDARSMAEFFNTLDRQSQGTEAAGLPEFLSTHPSPANRYTKVKQLAVDYQKKLNVMNPVINRNHFLQWIDGIVYGEDPRQGYLEDGYFYHPELRFQFPVPQGWKYQNSPQQVQFASSDGKAVFILMNAPGSDLQQAASAMLQQNNLQAVQSQETTINGNAALVVVADSKAEQAQQQQQQAQPPVRTLSYFIRYNNVIYLLLGASLRSDFDTYSPYFVRSAQGFGPITDQRKINKKPVRVHIKTIGTATTLEQALRNYGMPATRLNELAILNGLKLTDRLAAGTMIKILAE